MAIVDEQIYMVSNFRSDALMQYFGTATLSDGQYTRIAELRDTISTKRLHRDEKRNALYFFAQGKNEVRGIYKYDLSEGKLFRKPIEGGGEPMASDEDYLYWHTRSQIYRLKKF